MEKSSGHLRTNSDSGFMRMCRPAITGLSCVWTDLPRMLRSPVTAISSIARRNRPYDDGMARLHPANGEGDEVTRAAVLPIFVAAIAAAQQDTPSPTFRAGTKLVEVDVVARSQGAPATGLSKDDSTLLDNGKPRKIA